MSSDKSYRSDTSGTSYYFTPDQSPSHSYSEVESESLDLPTVMDSVPTVAASITDSRSRDKTISSLPSTPSTSSTLRSPNCCHFIPDDPVKRWTQQVNNDCQTSFSLPGNSISVREVLVKIEDLTEWMNTMKSEMEVKLAEVHSLVSRLSLDEASNSAEGNQDIQQNHVANIQSFTQNMDTSAPVVRGPSRLEQQFQTVKHHFTYLPALVKGFLTRRLLKTEKVQSIREVIYDLVVELLEFDDEAMNNISEADVLYHERLMTHLQTALNQFYSLVMETTVSEQMAIIREDREKKVALTLTPIKLRYRPGSHLLKCQSSSPRPTSATIKRRERLQQQRSVSVADGGRYIKKRKRMF